MTLATDYNLITVRPPQIQQQTNSIDCGVLAIANADQFCYNYYQGMYDAPYLRPHIIHCLETRIFTPLPRTKAKSNKKGDIHGGSM